MPAMLQVTQRESGGMSSSHTTTMAWIILAACSLCLSTFPSRAETAEGAWQRMIGVQAKLKPLSDAWVNCTLRQADTFALQPEPIETIIPAIFAACSGFEQMMIKVLAENGMASQVGLFPSANARDGHAGDHLRNSEKARKVIRPRRPFAQRARSVM
jgi:hypothetical protein